MTVSHDIIIKQLAHNIRGDFTAKHAGQDRYTYEEITAIADGYYARADEFGLLPQFAMLDNPEHPKRPCTVSHKSALREAVKRCATDSGAEIDLRRVVGVA